MIRLKNIFRTLMIMCCVLLFQACPMPDKEIIFLYLENNSNDTLAVYIADGSHTAYPDTLLPQKHQGVRITGTDNNMTGAIYSFRGAPEESFKRLQKDTLSIFIFDANNFSGIIINMDSIWAEMNYGKSFLWRYDLSLQDIKILKYKISYPSDERMKNMKMYPPYGE